MRRRNLIALASATSMAWPMAARAQPAGKTHRLAILTQTGRLDRASGKRLRIWTVFFDELRRLGYDEDRNLVVDWRLSSGDAARAAALAREVVAAKPDVVFSIDQRMAVALKAATATIPVVTTAIDPVATGLAASLARPGGNVTGFSVDAGLELFGKRVELLRQAAPGASRVALLFPRRVLELPNWHRAHHETARRAGFTIVDAILEHPVDEAEYRRVFAAMAQDGVDSLSVGSSLENLVHRRLIADLATAARLPAVYVYREHVEAGGLMAYGVDLADILRRAAGYVDRILRGANPAEMPFQQPAKFELVINLGAAKAIGVTIPQALLARADEVIE
jgi:putative ABC transport system substrate-binding protein